MIMTEIPFHPFANIFPLMEGAEFEELIAAPVRRDGVREPIWIYEGKILDGRNRYRAALAAGVPCPTRLYEGNDALGFVIALNLHRRHLDESQRAMVAAKLATMRQGERTDLEPSENLPKVSQEEAATLLNISDRTLRYAKAVQERGADDLIRAVETGNVRVSVAADIATLSKDEQRAILARMDTREILQRAKEIRAVRAAENRAIWNARTIALSKTTSPLPCERRYPVILADPPWEFRIFDAASGSSRCPEAHYPTMSTEAICAMPVGEIATPDAALFLWTTASTFPEALSVLEAGGFKYVTHIVWVKHTHGLGYWVRNQHEVLIIASRGDMRGPAEGDRPSSVINAPRREHSRKPDEAYELIERMYPELPKIKLFARNAREGWSCWGNQAPESLTMAG
jgi:N6-adenosine-specific RNA methylase IME4